MQFPNAPELRRFTLTLAARAQNELGPSTAPEVGGTPLSLYTHSHITHRVAHKPCHTLMRSK